MYFCLVPLSPQDSEDQTTPQASRKFYVPKQTSVESTNSYSENDDISEGQIKPSRDDPETTKKKEMHKNLMNEALKKVEMRNIQKKNFSQLARTNPTLAALNIVTRKELKMEELQEKYEQEDINRNRHKSGSAAKEDNSAVVQGANSSVNSGVLQTFRDLSIRKSNTGQNSASRQAAIAAKKASTPVKPDVTPKPSISKEPVSTSLSDLNTGTADPSTPMVVLRKQPRILEPDELKARTSGSGAIGGNATPGNDAVSSLPSKASNLNNVSSVQETKEKAEQNQVETSSNKPSVVTPVIKPEKHDITNTQAKSSSAFHPKVSEMAFSQERKPTSPKHTPSSVKESEVRVEKATEKVNAAKDKQQKIDNQKPAVSVKQNLEGLVHVKPKQDNGTTVVKANDNDNEASQKLVKRAAEKFEASVNEANNKDFSNSVNFSSQIRGRSKSISNRLREQMEDSKQLETRSSAKTALPWNGRSPPVVRRKESMNRNNKGNGFQNFLKISRV